jgi:hypothetical protein
VPLALTIEGKIPAARVAEVVRAASSSAGYEAREEPRRLILQKSVEPCDPVKARAMLEKLSGPSCALNLDAFGKGECIDSQVLLAPVNESSTAIKVSQLRAGSLLYSLGLREGDVLQDDRGTLAARRLEPHFELHVIRGEEKKTLQCKVSGEASYLHPMNMLKDSLGPIAPAAACFIDPALISTKGDTVEVEASRASHYEFSCLMTQTRIVPSYKDGKAQGFKLYAIRANTLLSLLGLQNGDTVKSINGRELDTPDKALEVYSALHEEKKFTLEFERRGSAKTLVIVLK